jgi:hypothetical protein
MCALPAIAGAAIITTLYGDIDGFGVGQHSGTLTSPTTDNAGPGEAPLTDVRLIGIGFLGNGPFAPTGSFAPFSPTGPILSATLTMRAGSWDSGPTPVDADDGFPNRLVLDGMDVLGFLTMFQTANTDAIEEFSISLPVTFFPLLGDGSVSLLNTHLSEDLGSASFQIDFLRLTIETAAVPAPGTLALLGLGLIAFGGLRRRLS